MLKKFAEACIDRRWLVVGIMFVLSAVFAALSTQVKFKTEFQDLLPVSHQYITTNDEYKETFGGSNIVSIMVEVEEGDIFRHDILEKIQSITEQMNFVPAVNQYQITSLASRKLKDIKASTFGIETAPLMFPDLPKNDLEIAQLKEAVLSNPLVYGRYVSLDQKSALITVDFIDRLIDYEKIFNKITQVVKDHESEGVKVRAVGEPILTGWIIHFLPETLKIFGLTISAMALLLFVTVRTFRGVLLPMLAGAISGSWALGMAALLGVNFDPLIIVIAFLVSARVISHAVQLSTAFDDEVARGLTAIEAAKASMTALFRPGMLGVATDTAAVMVVYIMPMPLLKKTAIIGSIWVSTIALSAIVLTPVLLSWVKRPGKVDFPVNTSLVIEKILNRCADVVIGRGAWVIAGLSVFIFLTAGYFAFNVTVGDANPGSPLLWPDSRYNQDASAINKAFQGSDRMFVVVEGKQGDVLKQPKTLHNMENFQRYLENQPEIGGTVSLVDLIGPVNVSLHEGNKRFDEYGSEANINGELVYMYLQGSDPGDIDRFSDVNYQVGAVTAYFRDHKGETIRTAISRIKTYIADNPLENAEYRLAGGLIGVLAAVNEEIFRGQVESIALALLVLFVLSAIAYRSTVAGLFFIPLVLMSNAVTFAFMYWQDIGMNINTLPVAALGIGLGVDYAFYIVDGVRERYIENRDKDAALRGSLLTAGRGVLVTGTTMILSVLLWYNSSLRFQAEMGLLIGLWLAVSAISSIFLIPAMISIIKPAFIFDVDELDGNAEASATTA